MFKRPLLIVILVVCALLALAAGVLLAVSQKESLAPGLSIAGVDVGKMSSAEASQIVSRKVAEPINKQKITIVAGDKQKVVAVGDLEVSVPVKEAVMQAEAESKQGPFWSRGLRQIFGSKSEIALVPKPNQKKINAKARSLNRSFTVAAKDASIALYPSGPKLRDGRDGSRVAGGSKAIAAAINAGLAGKPQQLRVVSVTPKVSRDDLRKAPSIIVVKSKFKAYFYHGTKKIKSYDVAVGQSAYPTPEGRFQINGKQVNPVWSVPNSAWAGEMAGQTVAGGTAANPLVARWMGITDGVGFHGTRDEGSVGSAASHGCLRMRPSDIIEWYPQVPNGTPVLITG